MVKIPHAKGTVARIRVQRVWVVEHVVIVGPERAQAGEERDKQETISNSRVHSNQLPVFCIRKHLVSVCDFAKDVLSPRGTVLVRVAAEGRRYVSPGTVS